MEVPLKDGDSAFSVAFGSSVLFSLPYQPIMPGLSLVATPIGNLADITLRAVMALLSADIILCEDTRHSQKLLQAYGLKKKCLKYNDHSDEKQREKIVALLQTGKSVALISDAGLPLVSDPGYKLVRAVASLGLPVGCYPGASAGLTALVTSGLPTESFQFVGFAPARDKARKDRLQALSTVPVTLIFYESAQRLHKMAQTALEVFGDRPCAFGRELTKKFEQTWRGQLSDLVLYLTRTDLRGECVFLVAGASKELEAREKPMAWQAEAQVLVGNQPLKAGAKYLAEKYGVSRNAAYAYMLSLKNKIFETKDN